MKLPFYFIPEWARLICLKYFLGFRSNKNSEHNHSEQAPLPCLWNNWLFTIYLQQENFCSELQKYNLQ